MTFRNSKTKKSTTKKYRCVVKPTMEEPDDPTPVEATKITDAKATTAKTVTVTFDGVVDTSTSTAIKLTRGTTEVTVTPTYASDAKSVILTSDTTLAAGTYTVTVGSFEPASFNVTKQTPTSLKITNTKVANKANARVYFEVLDQYNDVMTNYTDSKLIVRAYNVTKGHDIAQHQYTKKEYIQLDCSTETVSTDQHLNAIGDKVSVVAYLKDNASVACTTELEIVRIYTESLQFGEIKLGDDKRVTVNRTYELPYTAKDTEGNDVTLDYKAAIGGTAATVAIDNYNFISSNVPSVNMGEISVDSQGRLNFVAGNTAGTAVITAINTITGETSSITIVVNNTAKLSSLDIADASVACNTAGTTKVKAAVTAYDQFGTVIDPKNVKNVPIASGDYFNSVTATPTGKIKINKITSDGQYVEYEVQSVSIADRGQSVTFNFVSKEMGETGYIRSSSTVSIDDEIEASALEIVKEPDATVEENKTVSVQFAVKDQYQNKIAMTASPAGFAFNSSCDCVVRVENTNGVVASSAVTPVAGEDDVYKMELTAPAINDLYKSGTFTLKLEENGGRVISSKLFNLVVVDSIARYTVTTDKTKYNAGDTIHVTVDAYSAGGFNARYNGTVSAKVTAAGKNSTKTLKFENGVATFELTAGSAKDNCTVTVTNQNNTSVTGTSDAYNVIASTAGKLSVNADGKLFISDSQGNEIVSSDISKSYATIKVWDETAKEDVTKSTTISSGAIIDLNDDNTVEIDLGPNNTVTTMGGIDYKFVADNFGVKVPDTNSAKHQYVLSITVNGLTWEQKFDSDGSAEEPVNNPAAQKAYEAKLLSIAKATEDAHAVTGALVAASGTAIATNGLKADLSSAVSGSVITVAGRITAVSAGAVSAGSVTAGSVTGKNVTITASPSAVEIKAGTTKELTIKLPQDVIDHLTAGSATFKNTDYVTIEFTITSKNNGNDADLTAPITIEVKYAYDGSDWTGAIVP